MKTIAQQLGVTDFPFIVKDNNGKQLYYETSDGYWEKWEYDSEGRVIYYEDSTGYWRKFEYDSDGNEIYYENSDGDWRKFEYDSNGNETYYESEDNRHKTECIKITTTKPLTPKTNENNRTTKTKTDMKRSPSKKLKL